MQLKAHSSIPPFEYRRLQLSVSGAALRHWLVLGSPGGLFDDRDRDLVHCRCLGNDSLSEYQELRKVYALLPTKRAPLTAPVGLEMVRELRLAVPIGTRQLLNAETPLPVAFAACYIGHAEHATGCVF